MPLDPEGQLRRKMRSILGEGGITQDETFNLFRLIRLLLEHHRLKANFPIVQFYCNWLVHTELRKSHEMAFNIFGQIADQIPDMHTDHMGKFMGRTLGIPGLRVQIEALFLQFDIPTDLVISFRNWHQLSSLLVHEVQERPLLLSPDNRPGLRNRAASHYQQIAARSTFVPYSLFLKRLETEVELHGREPGIYWHIHIVRTGVDPYPVPPNFRPIEINGILEAPEGRERFRHD